MKQYMEYVEYPWGRYFVIQDELSYRIKRLEIDPGQMIPTNLQYLCSLVFTVVQGSPTITLDGFCHNYEIGETLLIPTECSYKIENLTHSKVALIEVRTGEYLLEGEMEE